MLRACKSAARHEPHKVNEAAGTHFLLNGSTCFSLKVDRPDLSRLLRHEAPCGGRRPARSSAMRPPLDDARAARLWRGCRSGGPISPPPRRGQQRRRLLERRRRALWADPAASAVRAGKRAPIPTPVINRRAALRKLLHMCACVCLCMCVCHALVES